MDAVLTVLRWLAFVAGLCGWFCLVSCLTKLKDAFILIFTLCVLTLTLFTAGLLHLIYPMAWILFFGGIGLFVYFTVRAARKKFSLSFLISPGLVFFFVFSAAFIPILWGVRLYHYDNFSHWGTVLSEMLAFNDFPTAQTIVVFRDYAPGTASFLYWFSLLVGKTEDVALMGQALFSAAALSALFFRIKKILTFRFLSYSVVSVVLVSLLVFDDGTLQVYNLLVDALIGFLAVSIWFLREAYRERPLTAWLFITPIMTFLMLVKSNAALCMVFFAVFLLYDAWKLGLKKWKHWLFLFPFAGAGLWYFLWKIYRDLTYGTGTNSYGFQSVFARGSAFYLGIWNTFWQKITDFSKIYVVVFVFLNILVVLALLLLRYKKKDCSYLFRTFLSANFLMVGYAAALMFMYAFIMATGEARHLAAFERYIITPTIIFTAMMMEAFITSFAHVLEDRPLPVRFLPLCASLLLFTLVSGQASQLIYRPDFDSTERGKVMESLELASETIPRNAKVVLCNGERGRRDMYYYLTMYQLKTRVVFILDFSQPEVSIPKDVQNLRNYEYMVISSNHYKIVSSLVKAGFQVTWKNGCSLYRINTLANGTVNITPAVTSLSH